MNITTHSAGLGLRRALLSTLEQQTSAEIDFMELVPENWLGVGGQLGKKLRYFTERYPFVAHGLSLNLGGFTPLDQAFLQRLKHFLKTHQVLHYTEHLSYCGDEGHLYDLMPIPFTEEAIKHVVARIKQTQDILEQRIAIENISYYAAPSKAMNEITFINAILEDADCNLLLDVNNIYVNSINHDYDAAMFLKSLPKSRIVYAHIAGHYQEAEDFIIDTHGAKVIDPVWQLLDEAYRHFGIFPTLLERDFNIPTLSELLKEVDIIANKQSQFSAQKAHTHVQSF